MTATDMAAEGYGEALILAELDVHLIDVEAIDVEEVA